MYKAKLARDSLACVKDSGVNVAVIFSDTKNIVHMMLQHLGNGS